MQKAQKRSSIKRPTQIRSFIKKVFNKENKSLTIICVLGILFRIYLMLEFPNMCCASDEYLYVHLANHIILGGQFIYMRQDEPGLWTNIVYGLKPPLYPYLLAVFFSIFGLASSLVKIIQIALAVVTGILLYKVGKEIFSKKTGLFACAIFMFFWEVAYFSQAFLSENMQWFLMSLFLYLTLVAKTKLKYLLIGLVLGLYVLTKPTAILFLLPLVFLLFPKSFSIQNIKNLFIYLFMIALLLAVTMSPWIFRNFYVYHQFVPVYTDGGINVWMGNYPESGGGYNIPKNNPKETPILHNKGPERELERDNFYYTSALNFMQQNPQKAIGLAISKIFLTFSAERPTMVNTATTTQRQWIFGLPKSDALNYALTHMIVFEFIGLQVLAFAGIIRIFIKKSVSKQIVFLLLILVLQLGCIMISHAETRYVMEMYPILFLFAAVSLSLIF